MADATSLIGAELPSETVVIERGPVQTFAIATKNDCPEYRSLEAALAAGFADVPVPPTFPFVANHWGAFTEMQPAQPPNAMNLGGVIGQLMHGGALLLHGGQEFIYHRPAVVGDRLTSTARITGVEEKQGSDGSSMTIVKTETEYRDDSGEPVVTMLMTLIFRRRAAKAG